MVAGSFWQKTEDWHTAGMPFRIVEDLPAGVLTKGLTVSQQYTTIANTPSHPLDLLRQSLAQEPIGHAAMYGAFILPPDDLGAHFGVLLWHTGGFSTACGNGTIALGYWAVAHGLVQPNPNGTAEIRIDVPSGRVTAKATFDQDGAVIHMDFINVSSHQISERTSISIDIAGETLSMGMVLSFGGAVIACVDVADLGLQVEPSQSQKFIDIARKIKAQHANYLYQDKYNLASVCFYEDKGESSEPIFQKNVTVYGDGQIDRSPCGSGTCARLAVLLAEGKVNAKKRLVHESIIGMKFEAHVMEEVDGSPFLSCIPRVRGTARIVGKMNFFIDSEDPIYPGFILG
jgi:trans-L-3-hydroxyproline dehydratase